MKKMNTLIKIFLTITLLSAKSLFAQSEGTICLAPYWGGILAGYSSEREVVKLYGEGIKLDSLGDTGCRFYTDSNRSITILVIFSTDCLVENLKLITGFHPPKQIGVESYEKMISDFINPVDVFGYWQELHFGDSMEKVEKNLGPPNQKYAHSEIMWVYNSICHCELSSAIIFGFKNGKLNSISFFQNFG